MTTLIDPSLITGKNYKPDSSGDKVSNMILTKTDETTGTISINNESYDGITITDWTNIFNIVGWDLNYAPVMFRAKHTSIQTLTRKETTNVLRYLHYVKTGVLQQKRQGGNGFA